jgi:hypothetical protein
MANGRIRLLQLANLVFQTVKSATMAQFVKNAILENYSHLIKLHVRTHVMKEVSHKVRNVNNAHQTASSVQMTPIANYVVIAST